MTINQCEADPAPSEQTVHGWIPVAAAAELDAVGVVPVRVYGDDLVLWRGESGEPHALDAYCRHLGHHLGYGGRVCGEDVRCFYHGWTWSPEGANTDIPYDTRTYKGRRIPGWEVAERSGLIYVWYAIGEARRQPGRPAPVLPPDPAAGFVLRQAIEIQTQDLIEQFVDPYTFGYSTSLHPVESVAEVAADHLFTVKHTFADSGVAVVRVFDAATVIVEASDWSVWIAMCPTNSTQLDIRANTTAGREATLECALRLAELTPTTEFDNASRPEAARTYRAWAARMGG